MIDSDSGIQTNVVFPMALSIRKEKTMETPGFDAFMEFKTEVEAPKSEKKQTIWRTMSGVPNDSIGFFVWEVYEAIGMTENENPPASYTKCRDGSYILISCNHFFTYEKAFNFINDNSFGEYQNIEYIYSPVEEFK